jgi:hypothetical protein
MKHISTRWRGLHTILPPTLREQLWSSILLKRLLQQIQEQGNKNVGHVAQAATDKIEAKKQEPASSKKEKAILSNRQVQSEISKEEGATSSVSGVNCTVLKMTKSL